MKIVTNTKLIERNAKIGKYASVAGLVVVGGAVLISFSNMKTEITVGQLTILAIASIVGFLVTQIGMYYTSRWGRSPRPDETITKALKGLGREFTIYHYVTPTPHLLVSPAGVWVIMGNYAAGTVTYSKKRWRIKGGGFAQSYLRFFGQDSMGRPDLDSAAEISAVKRYLDKVMPEGVTRPEVHAALLFLNPNTTLDTENAPLPAMLPKDLKEFLKNRAKESPLPELTQEALRRALPQPEKEE